MPITKKIVKNPNFSLNYDELLRVMLNEPEGLSGVGALPKHIVKTGIKTIGKCLLPVPPLSVGILMSGVGVVCNVKKALACSDRVKEEMKRQINEFERVDDVEEIKEESPPQMKMM